MLCILIRIASRGDCNECTQYNMIIQKILKTSLNFIHLPLDLALWLTISGSNYPCLEQFYMVPKMFGLLTPDCIISAAVSSRNQVIDLKSKHEPPNSKRPYDICDKRRLWLFTHPACVDSDQPAHLYNLIRTCVVHYYNIWGPYNTLATSVDSDQTARMRRLVWVNGGHMCLCFLSGRAQVIINISMLCISHNLHIALLSAHVYGCFIVWCRSSRNLLKWRCHCICKHGRLSLVCAFASSFAVRLIHSSASIVSVSEKRRPYKTVLIRIRRLIWAFAVSTCP